MYFASGRIVVVGGIGAGAISKLNAMGIKVYRASKGVIRDNIRSFNINSLPELTTEHACSGHSQSGGCAHH